MGNYPKIKRGTQVIATNARGERNERIALSEPVMGRDFLVVWVCPPAEWITAQSERRAPKGVPWPAEDVELVEDTANCEKRLP